MNRKFTNRNGGTGILPVWENRAGFTLVEMLVVVLIIAILAGLISAVAIRARNRAKVAVIALEINQLSMALENYKNQFGEYPPDFSGCDTDLGKAIVLRHLSKAFPRLVIPGANDVDKWNNLKLIPYFLNLDSFINNPAMALPAWLGGMTDAQGRPIGFSKDPANPFDRTTTSRIGPFFDFDPGRTQNKMYYPPGVIPGTGQPYVYFRAEVGRSDPYREYYKFDGTNYAIKQGFTSGPMPYWDQRTKGWVNPNSFQILCCGLDGSFGQENVYPTGLVAGAGVPDGTAGTPDLTADVVGLPTGNFDHIDDQTNFTSGTIGDDLP